MYTFSQANSTGAVAKPSFRSAAVGLPMASLLDTKSKRSSTSWNAKPMFRPYSNDTSTNWSSAPANIASCGINNDKMNNNSENYRKKHYFFSRQIGIYTIHYQCRKYTMKFLFSSIITNIIDETRRFLFISMILSDE